MNSILSRKEISRGTPFFMHKIFKKFHIEAKNLEAKAFFVIFFSLQIAYTSHLYERCAVSIEKAMLAYTFVGCVRQRRLASNASFRSLAIGTRNI